MTLARVFNVLCGLSVPAETWVSERGAHLSLCTVLINDSSFYKNVNM